MGKNSLERSHISKRYIFSFSFLQKLFDFFLRLKFFLVKNLCSLKAIKLVSIFFSYVLFFFFFASYNLNILYSFLGLGYISP